MPNITSSVDLVTGGKVRAPMWVGTKSDLTHLVRICHELQEVAEKEIQEQFRQGQSERAAKFNSSYGGLRAEDENATRLATAELTLQTEMIQAVQLSMATRRKKWEVAASGDPDLILAQLDDPEDVEQITIKLANAFDWRVPQKSGFEIVINKAGIEATIFSFNTNWIVLASSKFRDEFQRTRPWYWWVYRWWFVVPAFFVPWSVATLVLISSLQTLGVPVLTIVCAVISLSCGAGILIPKVAHSVAPHFELVGDSNARKGGRGLTLLGTAAAWIATTVVAPVVLSLIFKT